MAGRLTLLIIAVGAVISGAAFARSTLMTAGGQSDWRHSKESAYEAAKLEARLELSKKCRAANGYIKRDLIEYATAFCSRRETKTSGTEHRCGVSASAPCESLKD